ncbi:P-loop containing nucleoside triphosphate hydrolase protein [Pholiota molesta]|nr:P-loop containing nucleoside triphosphate hydrolase protein [Pholiota molesta]
MATPSTFSQNIFRSVYPDIVVSACDEDDIRASLPDFFESIEDDVIGLAPLYTAKCRLDKVALASRTRILVVTLENQRKTKAKKALTLEPHESLRSLFCHPIGKCTGRPYPCGSRGNMLKRSFNTKSTTLIDFIPLVAHPFTRHNPLPSTTTALSRTPPRRVPLPHQGMWAGIQDDSCERPADVGHDGGHVITGNGKRCRRGRAAEVNRTNQPPQRRPLSRTRCQTGKPPTLRARRRPQPTPQPTPPPTHRQATPPRTHRGPPATHARRRRDLLGRLSSTSTTTSTSGRSSGATAYTTHGDAAARRPPLARPTTARDTRGLTARAYANGLRERRGNDSVLGHHELPRRSRHRTMFPAVAHHTPAAPHRITVSVAVVVVRTRRVPIPVPIPDYPREFNPRVHGYGYARVWDYPYRKQLVAMKPTRTKNEITPESATNSGEITVKSERYQTRVRASGGQEIRLNAVAPDGTISAYTSRSTDVTGRLATLSINGDVRTLEVQSVETGTISLGSFPFVSAIFSTKQISWKDSPKLTSSPALYFPTGRTLNDSQTKAVNAILSNDDANPSVTSIMAEPDTTRTVWLLAHSNVAVKNIAEKLASVDFLDFKILVNKEFRFDWHEHLYTKIENNLIRSDDFNTDSIITERQLKGSKVILCTLNTLANDRLDGIAQLVPIDTVIIDEASQIEVGNFLPMIVRFRSTLRQLVFVGDDKQLPPYAANDIKELDSIFEMKHLRERKPNADPLGDFISKNVYDDKLKSEHLITSPRCCSFVDVSDGREESQQHSWKNIREAAVVVAITKQLTDSGKSFRIITPYDSQRSLIESSLKHADLPWEDKCFNVDSFQGNEDDYIVISLVRSNKLGFLQEMQRVNVMLTRCKRGMIICTSRNFLEGPAADSLVGILRKSNEFLHVEWLDGGQVQFDGLQSFF